jgi:hypothetical protein
MFGDGMGLAGEQGFVHAGTPLRHRTVGREALPRPHQDVVAGCQLDRRHRLILAAVRIARQQQGRGGDQLDQAFRRLGRTLAGVHLQEAAGEQEEHEHGHRVEIHLLAADQGAVHAGGEGGAHAQGHRHVHAGTLELEIAPGALEERQGGIEHHRRGQQHAGEAHERLDVARHGVFVGQVGGHGVHHDLHHAQAGDGQAADGGVALLAEQLLLAAGVERVGVVADVGDALQDVGQMDAAVVPAHPGPPGGEIDVRRQHPGQLVQVTLVQPDAGGADDALQDQAGLARVALALDEARLHFGQVVELEVLQFLQGRFRRLRQIGAQPVIVGVAGIDDGLGHRLAAQAAGGFRFTLVDDAVMAAGGHRLAAMEAALGVLAFGHGAGFYPAPPT